MQLILGEEHTQAATIPVRWCFSPSEIALLAENRKLEPRVMLVVRDSNGKEIDHQLLRPTDAMTYVQFMGPGHHDILAAVILKKEKSESGWDQAEQFFFQTQNFSTYRTNFSRMALNVEQEPVPIVSLPEAKGYSDSWPSGFFLANIDQDCFGVEVDPEFFAKRPPDWNYVNGIYSHPPVDQCQFRRRRIFAYSIWPIAVFLWSIFATLIRIGGALWALYRGRRHINWKTLTKLAGGECYDIWTDCYDGPEDCIFKTDKHGNPRSKWFALLSPSWFTLYGAIGLLIWWGFSDPATGQILFGIAGILAAIAAAVLIFFYWLNHKVPVDKDKVFVEDLRNTASCELSDLRPNLTALPKRKRTARLRFWATKSGVCRPFVN